MVVELEEQMKSKKRIRKRDKEKREYHELE